MVCSSLLQCILWASTIFIFLYKLHIAQPALYCGHAAGYLVQASLSGILIKTTYLINYLIKGYRWKVDELWNGSQFTDASINLICNSDLFSNFIMHLQIFNQHTFSGLIFIQFATATTKTKAGPWSSTPLCPKSKVQDVNFSTTSSGSLINDFPATGAHLFKQFSVQLSSVSSEQWQFEYNETRSNFLYQPSSRSTSYRPWVARVEGADPDIKVVGTLNTYPKPRNYISA